MLGGEGRRRRGPDNGERIRSAERVVYKGRARRARQTTEGTVKARTGQDQLRFGAQDNICFPQRWRTKPKQKAWKPTTRQHKEVSVCVRASLSPSFSSNGNQGNKDFWLAPRLCFAAAGAPPEEQTPRSVLGEKHAQRISCILYGLTRGLPKWPVMVTNRSFAMQGQPPRMSLPLPRNHFAGHDVRMLHCGF